MIKLNKESLRRIVRETIERKIRRVDENSVEVIDVGGEVAEFVVAVLESRLASDADNIGTNVWEMMVGTLGDEAVPVPSRIEDVDHYASQAADKVLADPGIKDVITEICKRVLESAMEPQ